jgi:Restriction endonuclease AspBHI N-terminal/Restriction endonuclease
MVSSFKITVGQVFRVPYRGVQSDVSGLVSYQDLTRGTHGKPADSQKGMFFYQQVQEPGQKFNRLPAFIFLSNPFKRGEEGTPWVDVVEPDAGYCLFHGDNRRVGADPLSSRGNAKFVQAQHFYADPSLRKFAPPVLVFEQTEHRGTRRGYRRFCGFGVPVRHALATQKEKNGGYFTNLVIELALFRLEKENEQFPWNWIDLRRDRSVDADAALSAAPASWKKWVTEGELAVENCRRIVARQIVVDSSEQRQTTKEEEQILSQTLEYYEKEKHPFEGLASFIAQRVLGHQCRRGWVTKRSGDGGVDFVCRLDVGDPADRLSCASAVVLGQAKCVGLNTAIGGHALARVVARLQRGWIGVFVTTGVFSRAAQLELAQDRYPIVLINGQRLARILFEVLTQERINLTELLDRETDWYHRESSHLSPNRILEDAFWFDSGPGLSGSGDDEEGKHSAEKC